jgi:hypothetical protein
MTFELAACREFSGAYEYRRASEPTSMGIEHAGLLAVEPAAREDRSLAPTGPCGHENRGHRR